jgi:cytochrome c2
MMCIGMFMAILDVQVVATLLPTIQSALDIPPDQMNVLAVRAVHFCFYAGFCGLRRERQFPSADRMASFAGLFGRHADSKRLFGGVPPISSVAARRCNHIRRRAGGTCAYGRTNTETAPWSRRRAKVCETSRHCFTGTPSHGNLPYRELAERARDDCARAPKGICGACRRRPGVGPRHRGVFGRKAASLPDYDYSDALKSTNITWNEETLDKWLTDPQTVAPGAKMFFHLDNPQDRADVIAYLKERAK